MGIRDFIQYLKEHQERVHSGETLSETKRQTTLQEAEVMVGMAEAAVKELESVLKNRRINLPEEHAVRFAQDVFLHVASEEEKVKDKLREQNSP